MAVKMTKEQFEDVENKLAKWREERGLSAEIQKENLEVDFMKEYVICLEAARNDNDYEMVKRICNMIIVAINAGDVKYDSMQGIDNIVNVLYFLGYDPYLCLLEAIKELDSKTDSWKADYEKCKRY